jgi:signal transduction histidine kinase
VGRLKQDLRDGLATPPGDVESMDGLVATAHRLLDAELAFEEARHRLANAELESFSYSVSHNLRAPLRAIGGYARLFEEQYGGGLPSEAIGYLHKLTNSAVMMGQLIDGLLELSRAQRVNLVIEELDMAALVQQCWEALAPQRVDRVIRMTVGELPATDGDRRLIYQVWLNLLENAIKYTPAESPIEISARATDDARSSERSIDIDVCDRGPGVPEGDTERVFEKFQRGNHAGIGGVGLGLSICRGIIEAHGGKLSVSNRPGGGACFHMCLPNPGSPPQGPAPQD